MPSCSLHELTWLSGPGTLSQAGYLVGLGCLESRRLRDGRRREAFIRLRDCRKSYFYVYNSFPSGAELSLPKLNQHPLPFFLRLSHRVGEAVKVSSLINICRSPVSWHRVFEGGGRAFNKGLDSSCLENATRVSAMAAPRTILNLDRILTILRVDVC